MLHEMVHQWQAESGLRIDHRRTFRQKAREVGVLPAAKRPVSGTAPAPSSRAMGQCDTGGYPARSDGAATA
jgi:hypothetical protein